MATREKTRVVAASVAQSGLIQLLIIVAKLSYLIRVTLEFLQKLIVIGDDDRLFIFVFSHDLAIIDDSLRID